MGIYTQHIHGAREDLIRDHSYVTSNITKDYRNSGGLIDFKWIDIDMNLHPRILLPSSAQAQAPAPAGLS